MHKNQNGFGFVVLIIALVVFGGIGLLAWTIWGQNKKSDHTRFPVAQNVPKASKYLGTGIQTIKLKTNESVMMPSGAVLLLPEYDQNSVPVFNYNHTGKDNNALYIRSHLEAYHNGYSYKIDVGKCNTAEKFFDDYTQVVKTDCMVTLDIEKSHFPILEAADLTKDYVAQEKDSTQQILNSKPFLMAVGGDGRLTFPANNAKPYLEANDGAQANVSVVSDYGVVVIPFMADDFTSHKEKQAHIAGSTIVVKPSYSCTKAYQNNGQCDVNNILSYQITYMRRAPVKPDIVVYMLN